MAVTTRKFQSHLVVETEDLTIRDGAMFAIVADTDAVTVAAPARSRPTPPSNWYVFMVHVCSAPPVGVTSLFALIATAMGSGCAVWAIVEAETSKRRDWPLKESAGSFMAMSTPPLTDAVAAEVPLTRSPVLQASGKVTRTSVAHCVSCRIPSPGAAMAQPAAGSYPPTTTAGATVNGSRSSAGAVTTHDPISRATPSALYSFSETMCSPEAGRQEQAAAAAAAAAVDSKSGGAEGARR